MKTYIVSLLNEKAYFEDIEEIYVNKLYFYDFYINLDDFNAVIFTSKNAFKSCIKNNINLANKEIYCIGKQCAEYILSFGYKVYYYGKTSHASEFKYELLNLLKDKKCVYFKAFKIISDLDEFLAKNNINITSINCYENIRLEKALDKNKKEFKIGIKDVDILIFLAPSGVRDFYHHFKTFSKNIIAIGQSTKKELVSFGINNVLTPKETSVNACVDLARQINLSNKY